MKRKQQEMEHKRDRQYKRMLNIFSKEHKGSLSSSGYDSEDDSSEYESSQENVSVSIVEQNSTEGNTKTNSQATTLKVGTGTGIEFENYNG